jgi:hypothetical protein
VDVRIAGYAAFGAALVYVALKALWVAGFDVGVVEVPPAGWVAGNVGTGLFGVVGAVVALATVRPWGRRIPWWLLAVPMWVGAGLLAPFVVLMPAAVVLAPPDSPDAQLEPWVFVVVYGSFIVLGVGLTVALPLYARARLGVVVRGTVGQAPPGVTHAAQVALAWVAAAAAAGVAALRLSWVFGADVGLDAGTRGAWLRLGDAVTAAQALAAALGVLVLVHRWGSRRPFAAPLTATWLGAGGMVGAGFLGMATILSGDRWAPTGQTFPAHATATFLTACAGAAISVVALVLLLERRAVLSHRAGSVPVCGSRVPT